MGSTIGITFNRDGGHCDHRTCRKSFFDIVVLLFPLGEPEAPAVVMDHHG